MHSVVPEATEHISQNGKSFLDAAQSANTNGENEQKEKKSKSKDDLFANRKPISEVLHDIYDRKWKIFKILKVKSKKAKLNDSALEVQRF